MPTSTVYRAEARGMAESYLAALLDHTPAGAVSGVYLKGSCLRPWDSDIDYVPEVSDVDVHVRFADTFADEAGLGLGSAFAARVAEAALAGFHMRFPEPLHTPRPQVVVTNALERQPGYLPSPPSTVETLFGVAYPEASREDYRTAIAADRERFVTDAAFVRQEVPWKLIDRPGPSAWQAVRVLTWRVGPAGPRLLTQLGVDPFDAWSMNRTAVVRALEDRASPTLAAHYRSFYQAGWEGFRTRFGAVEPAYAAVAAAERLFAEGTESISSRG